MSKEIIAKHRFITDECRHNKGDEQTRQEIGYDVRCALDDLLASWPTGQGVKIHVRVSVEYGDGS